MTTKTILGQPLVSHDAVAVLRALHFTKGVFFALTPFQQLAFLKVLTISSIGGICLGNVDEMLRYITALSDDMKRQTHIDNLESLPVAGRA